MERRAQLHADIAAGGLPIDVAIRRMRHALGMTQAAFGTAFKLTERQVWELEHGRGNPTMETMARIGKRFGYAVGFVAPKQPED